MSDPQEYIFASEKIAEAFYAFRRTLEKTVAVFVANELELEARGCLDRRRRNRLYRKRNKVLQRVGLR